MSTPEYLGDAVYASFDAQGYLVISTDSHLPEDARSVIYLEPRVVDSLLRYIEDRRERIDF